MITTTRTILLLALCASSLIFSMEPKNVKIKSLKKLALNAVLKNPQSIINQEEQIKHECKLIIHKKIVSAITYLDIAIASAKNKGSYDFNSYTLDSMLWLLLNGEEYKNMSWSQLYFLGKIKAKQIEKQKRLKLTQYEAQLFNNLSPRLQTDLAQHVIQPGL